MTRWRPEYAIGVEEIDTEHQELFALCAKLRASGSGGRILDEILARLRHHFAHEEERMREMDYPHYEAHHEEHELLCVETLALQRRYQAGDSTAAEELVEVLSDWLTRHTTTTDRRMGNFMRRHNLAEALANC